MSELTELHDEPLDLEKMAHSILMAGVPPRPARGAIEDRYCVGCDRVTHWLRTRHGAWHVWSCTECGRTS